MNNKGTRINKYLSSAGVCSRRRADELIMEGRIKINNQIANLGSLVNPSDIVMFDSNIIEKKEPEIFLAFHKPIGIVCTTSKKEKDNIIDYINYEYRIYPVGRLDKDSEGLILLTNNGEIMDRILRSRNGHQKEYIVTVNKSISTEFIKRMSEGVPILNTVTKPCEVTKINKDTFKIILTQGLNRQIRRMCKELTYHVVSLKRIRIMNINLGTLKTGESRLLTKKEIKVLKTML